MNNMYVAYLSEITEDDLVAAKKIDKGDRLLLFTGEDASMPCSYFLYLKALKITPEFMPDINSQMILGFILGAQCAGVNGALNIISKNEKFLELDSCDFDVDKGSVHVNIYNSFEDAFRAKRTKKDEGERKKTGKASKEELSDEPPVLDEEIVTYKPASIRLINKLDEIDTLGYQLRNRADIIAHCLVEAEDDVVSQFKYQLCLHFGKNIGEAVYKVLEPYYEELKKIAKE